MQKPLLFILAFALIALLVGCRPPSRDGAAIYFDGKALELATASETGDMEAIRRLINDEGIDPNRTFSHQDGIPAVAWPLRANNLGGLRAMLENGADANARQTKFMNGENIHFDNAMVYAAKMEDPRFLELLLKHGGDPNTRNVNNETLLFQAFISSNRWENVQLLVKNGANVNESNRGSADTVLSWYSARGGFDSAYWLLEHGADPTILLTPPKESGKPARMTMVEDIYWEVTTPDLLPWQKKCQQWLVTHDIPRPPMPDGIRSKRAAFGFPTKEEDVPLL